jgi:ADP-heptose:LPS heptosyltransferase
MTTLVIHPGALGDVLLAVPALRAVRSMSARQPLTLAAQPRIGALLVRLGVVDHAVDFESLGLGALFASEPGGTAPPIVADAGRVVCWFGARDPLFVRRLREAAPAAVVAPSAADDLPVWQHLRRTLAAPVDGDDETIAVPATIGAEGRQALVDAGWDGATPLAMLHPGAGGTTKRWPLEGFVRVIEALGQRWGLRAVIHQGPADTDAVTALRSRLPGDTLLLDVPSLMALAGAFSHVALHLGNDSGVSHLAAALGTPSVAMFTRSFLPWRPWARAARVVVVSTSALEQADLAAVLDAVAEVVG